MARYSLGWQKTGITAAGAIMDIRATATDRLHVLEIGLFVSAVTGTNPVLTVGLARETALGTATGPVTVLAEEPGDPAGTGTVATAWSVAPTIATTYLRRFVANAVGAGIIWTWPDKGGLTIPVSVGLALTAPATPGGTTPNFTLDGYVVVDE
jgi:hypothetical protein